MAVSSDAIASAVKIAATAHRLRSQGRPSAKPLLTAEEGSFAAAFLMDMLANSPGRDAMAASAAFTTARLIPPRHPAACGLCARAQFGRLSTTSRAAIDRLGFPPKAVTMTRLSSALEGKALWTDR